MELTMRQLRLLIDAAIQEGSQAYGQSLQKEYFDLAGQLASMLSDRINTVKVIA